MKRLWAPLLPPAIKDWDYIAARVELDAGYCSLLQPKRRIPNAPQAAAYLKEDASICLCALHRGQNAVGRSIAWKSFDALRRSYSSRLFLLRNVPEGSFG